MGNRVIKFRGKRVDDGSWVHGEELNYVDKDCVDGKDTYVDGTEVIPETLGQYTGLKDKNGIEIYDGDVVRADMDFGPGGYIKQIASICWDEGVGGWQFNYFDKSTIEILGNIHDNPERVETREGRKLNGKSKC